MIASAGADVGTTARRSSARVRFPALALFVCAALAAVAARAQVDSTATPPEREHGAEPVGADSAGSRPAWMDSMRLAAPSELDPGRYGPVADSLVRARCQGLPIRRVDVRCLEIFDPLPVGGMNGIYGFVNTLHVKTRESTVRAQLLLAAGGVWDAERVEETERLLREMEFIEPDPVLSRVVDDSVDVLVVTHDQWTTQPELNIERGAGRTYGSIGISEENLLGLGIGLALVFHEDPTGKSRVGSVSGRRLFGTQLEGMFQAGTGDGDVSNAVSLRDPFRSLDDRMSWTASMWRVDASHQLFKDGSLAAEFPFKFEQGQLEWAWGSQSADGFVRRYALAFARNDRFYGPTVNEPGFEGTFPGGTEELKLRWVSGRVLYWRPQFIVRRGVELFDPAEDFDLGEVVGLETGLALRAFGSTANEGLVRARLETGRETRRFGFGYARGRVSTRLRGDPRETIATLDARWIQQPSRDVAIVTAAYGQVADEAPREVQFVVGGLNGLRAYPVQALAGTQSWRLNAEARWIAARGIADIASIGGAVFVDAAKSWDPGERREPWHSNAGFGLRISFPHASLHQVGRIDVAFPISPTRDGKREAVFSFGSSQAF